jgi:hypothetical protein
MQKFLKTALAASAILTAGVANAAVIDFENLPDMPATAPYLPYFTTHYDYFSQNGYDLLAYTTKAGAIAGSDLVGFVADGTDVANTCNDLKCPTNNATHFYGTLNDGGLAVFRSDTSAFKMSSLDASFIATPSTIVPGNSLVLLAFGYDSTGANVYTQRFDLPGPVGGGYTFSSYVFDAVNANTLVVEVDIQGYSCVTGSTSCGRASDKAQFALDNINVTPVPVPEPAEWLLMGLGLAVVGGLVRRRRAAGQQA